MFSGFRPGVRAKQAVACRVGWSEEQFIGEPGVTEDQRFDVGSSSYETGYDVLVREGKGLFGRKCEV